jgi:raffinose/stachyose/melibiose transport system permease protein
MSAIRFRVLPRTQDRPEADRLRRQWDKTLLIILFALPGMTIFTLFVLLPILQSLYFSLYDWDGFGPLTDYVQLENYERMLNHSVFQLSVAHSFTIMTLSLCFQLPLALGLALMVGRGRLWGRRIFRGILFIPFVFSEIITAIIWRYVLHSDEGLINTVLATLAPSISYDVLGNRDIVLLGIFAVITWKYFGLHMILYMAGLQAIPTDLEDAARVDGASEAEMLRYVTLPLLGSTIRLSIFLSVIGSFQQFVIVWVLTEGGPVNGSELIATYLFKFGIQRFNLGYGAAVAVLLFAMLLIFSLGYQRIILRRDYSADYV